MLDFFVIVDVLDVKVIAGLTVSVATVEVSVRVLLEPEKVIITRYLNLFIAVVKVAVVKVSVVKPVPLVDPLPLVTSVQATVEAAVIVSVATCHLIARVISAGAAEVLIVNESTNPAVVVSFAG